MSAKKAAELRQRLDNELRRASLDHCVKCTICETNCPVMGVTPLFGGPKYSGPQGERYRDGASVDSSIDYCSSCGTCTVVCPQGVQVSEIISLAKAVMRAENGIPLRDKLLTHTTLMGKMMTPVAPVANFALRNRPIRKAMEAIVGVAKDAPMPPAQTRSLYGWLKKRPPRQSPATNGPVVFFHGCAGGYFEVEASKCSIEVLEHLGYEVLVPKQGCCGLAAQSNGLFDQATKSVLNLVKDLASAGKDLPIVSNAGSCVGMLKHEASHYLGIKDPALEEIGTRSYDISQFLMERYEAGELVFNLQPIEMTLPYHQPCQVRSQGMGAPASDLLRLIPGLRVIDSNATCCGIAGTYGLKKEKYEVAAAVGKPLFDMVAETNEGLVACDTETCRWQIAKATKVPTVHPIVLFHQALGLKSGGRG
ncbi:anaerobic glycerol-3-phosphate dehydrogenase subunit C [Tessaracoccus sp. OH4464_COT-324]|uniref:anaerobic glycerol-3-phosphate dehydrogenase subunit C n=1 Tax=Tessaracoccus sp. OH4464_COT-324 TaxID=2491059 RepID=UPI000F632C1E|nr:anaerobic glycerol-3-phosphate dehydrogenase subunit C [Tessaracoccus sp. OH4464_COT-324]RRD46268.1 anaerobic glycerol-3-phosphate dehydrogenase subunit C [Tessaracoccus sp. OH4464_COT-324]